MPLAPAPLAAPASTAGPTAPPALPSATRFEARLADRSAGASPGPGPALCSPLPPQAGPTAPLPALLRGAEQAQARLDQLLAAARRGRGLAAGDLLVLQAEAYRFAQVLEVAGKVVEQGVQSVKQAIQTPT